MSDPWAQFPNVDDPWSMFPDADPSAINALNAAHQASPAGANIKPQWPFVDARLPSTLPWLAKQPTSYMSGSIDDPPAPDNSDNYGVFGRGPSNFAPSPNVASGLYPVNSGSRTETRLVYDQHLRELGIDPTTFYDLPKPLRDYIQSVMDSDSFKSAAEPIYQNDVKLKKETGGILDYLSPSADYDDPNFRWQNRLVPYEGKPAKNPSPQSTASMDAPGPDYSVGVPIFEWHPHPITQEGGNLPSEADLSRSLMYNLPGAIWYNNGSLLGGPTSILYLAHPLAAERK